METFKGFTEDDIKHLTTQKDTNLDEKPIQTKITSATAVYKQQQTKSRHQSRLSRKNVARERLLKGSLLNSNNDLPKEACLHIQQILEEEEEEEHDTQKGKNLKSLNLSSNDVDTSVSKDTKSQVNERKAASVEMSPSKFTEKTNTKCSLINESTNSEGSMQQQKSLSVLNSETTDVTTLQEFETRQKLMEEQNRQRKDILKRILADRAKKTHEEVKRLNEIEGELKKLDVLLSTDVAIIRNEIEAASIDFMEAQKRYDRAEKEFLDSKLDLFNKKERKELLTGHLCTIIEQNEMRKAKKLSDLMLQLELGSKGSLITSQITVEYKSEETTNEKNLQNRNNEEENTISDKEHIKTENAADL